MTLLLKQLFKLVYLLNSETGSRSIAAGVCCGLVLGFSPLLSLQSLVVLVVLFVFRVQVGAALLSMAGFKMVSPLFTPLYHRIGAPILGSELLEPLFTILYNAPLVPLTRFYNTVVMGSAVLALVLVPPVYAATLWLVNRYREKVVSRLKRTRLWSLWRSTVLYKWYQHYRSVFG